MAQYFVDFSAAEGYTLGSVIGQGWTSRWNLSGTATVTADVDADDGRAVYVTGTTANTNMLISLDAVDSDGDRATVEVIARTKHSSGSGTVHQGIAVRGAGTSSAATGYVLFHEADNKVRISRFPNSNTRNDLVVATPISATTGTYLYQKFQVTGTNPTLLKGKMWTGVLGDEPASWDVEYSDSAASRIESAGWIGLFKRSGLDYSWDWIGIGTGGDSAPTELPAVGSKGVEVTLYADDVARSSVTGITAMWWDSSPPTGNPVLTTSSASTTVAGVLALDISGSTSLAVGDSGYLMVYKLDGSDEKNSIAWQGELVVVDTT